MTFRLVDSGWDRLIDESLHADHSTVRIISPFVKERAASRFLKHGRPARIQVITRFDLEGFVQGISDISALRLLLDAGAQIRGIKHLHAKAYLFGANHAIVTSANLTEQALTRNQEFGFHAEDPSVVASCHEYFDKLWHKAGTDLTVPTLNRWDQSVTDRLRSGAGTRIFPSLGDEGTDIGFDEAPLPPCSWRYEADQGFVKFFGEGHNRENPELAVIEEVKRAGCHWACSYPRGKRPRQVRDGAVMFMGRLVRNPVDTLIFGRAIGMKYVEGRDDATQAEIDRRDWKAKWPRYIRVHDAEFINGKLSDGISLAELMDRFGAESFAPTSRHARAGVGNTNPRTAFSQQPAVELTPIAISWLNAQLGKAMKKHGKISPAELAGLDWPDPSVWRGRSG